MTLSANIQHRLKIIYVTMEVRMNVKRVLNSLTALFITDQKNVLNGSARKDMSHLFTGPSDCACRRNSRLVLDIINE